MLAVIQYPIRDEQKLVEQENPGLPGGGNNDVLWQTSDRVFAQVLVGKL